jgi:predicted signal transduction protein with EAL and GGDEF domain
MAIARRALLLLPLVPRAVAAQPPPVAPLPGGGWRLALPADALAPSAEQRAALVEIGRRLAADTTGRVTIWSEVSEASEDISAIRRRALERARAARAALVAGGLPETRVDLRALGRTDAARDVLDVMPPGVARP